MNARKFSMSMERPPDFQPINRIHVKYCCCISFILSNLFPIIPIIFQTFLLFLLHKNQPKYNKIYQSASAVAFLLYSFFGSAHLFFPNKKLPPILWTFGLWALQALWLEAWDETSCEGHLGTFKPQEFTEKKGEISWKWSRKTYNYIDFRRNLCFLLILINSYVINIDVFVL